MKTHTLLRYFLTAANLAAALALLPPHARAEDKPPTRPNKPSASAESKPSGYDLEIVEGEFVQKGKKVTATLGNVVDTLRNQYTNADIVLSPGLANLKIEDLKLRSGRLWEKLEAIRAASGSKFELEGPRLPVANLGPDSGLFVLRAAKPTPENERTVEAFKIAPFSWLRSVDPKLAEDRRDAEVSKKLDALEQIVRKTLESLKQGTAVEMPSFQFHRGANVLVVVGTREAVDVAGKVVSALPSFVSPDGGGGSFGVAPGLSKDDAELRKRYGLPPAQPPGPPPP